MATKCDMSKPTRIVSRLDRTPFSIDYLAHNFNSLFFCLTLFFSVIAHFNFCIADMTTVIKVEIRKAIKRQVMAMKTEIIASLKAEIPQTRIMKVMKVTMKMKMDFQLQRWRSCGHWINSWQVSGFSRVVDVCHNALNRTQYLELSPEMFSIATLSSV